MLLQIQETNLGILGAGTSYWNYFAHKAKGKMLMWFLDISLKSD